jgi:uncharacterized protein with HEPN domain
MISNAQSATGKKAAKRKPARRTKPASTKFVMVTFGPSNDELVDEFEAKAEALHWSRSALAREIIRKYFGYPTHLP